MQQRGVQPGRLESRATVVHERRARRRIAPAHRIPFTPNTTRHWRMQAQTHGRTNPKHHAMCTHPQHTHTRMLARTQHTTHARTLRFRDSAALSRFRTRRASSLVTGARLAPVKPPRLRWASGGTSVPPPLPPPPRVVAAPAGDALARLARACAREGLARGTAPRVTAPRAERVVAT